MEIEKENYEKQIATQLALLKLQQEDLANKTISEITDKFVDYRNQFRAQLSFNEMF